MVRTWVKPVFSITRREAELTAMVVAAIRAKSWSANPMATNAIAPSEAKPRPQRSRRSLKPSSPTRSPTWRSENHPTKAPERGSTVAQTSFSPPRGVKNPAPSFAPSSGLCRPPFRKRMTSGSRSSATRFSLSVSRANESERRAVSKDALIVFRVVPASALSGPRLLVDRELEVRKRRQPLFNSEDAQARDQRAGRKRGDGEARERRRAHACPTGAGIDDFPGQLALVERGQCSLATNGSLPIEGQRQGRPHKQTDRLPPRPTTQPHPPP